MVVHMHISVNTSIHTSFPHCFAWVKPYVVRCDLGVHVRWRTRCGPGVRHFGQNESSNTVLMNPATYLGDVGACYVPRRESDRKIAVMCLIQPK